MRFRIPPALKETVTVVRESAFKRDEETTIAENVVCQVQPGRDLIDVESGVPIKRSDLRTDWTVLLEKPNSDIIEGDFLRRLDGSELQVYGVRQIGDVMLLEINNAGVA